MMIQAYTTCYYTSQNNLEKYYYRSRIKPIGKENEYEHRKEKNQSEIENG